MIKKSEIDDIIKRCKEDDRRAQLLIYKSYYDRYYTLSLRYMEDHDLACDVVNQLFFKVFTQIDQLKDVKLFEGWMKKICINFCLNEIKKNKAFLFQDIETTVANDLPHSNNEGDSNIGMEELLDIVMRLPVQMRTVFNLYSVDGFTHQEIGKELGISIGTSKYHLHQAKGKLRRIIEEYSSIKTPPKTSII